MDICPALRRKIFITNFYMALCTQILINTGVGYTKQIFGDFLELFIYRTNFDMSREILPVLRFEQISFKILNLGL